MYRPTSAESDEVATGQYFPGPDGMDESEVNLRQELTKTEEEILTLRQVLAAKTQQATELKKKLGVTVWTEMKTDLKTGIQSIRESDTVQRTNDKIRQLNEKVKASAAYQRTSDVVQTAKEKTTTGFNAAGTKVTERLSSFRNSTAFKSFEERMGSAYCSVKDRLSGSRSEHDFEEALKEELEKREEANKEGRAAEGAVGNL